MTSERHDTKTESRRRHAYRLQIQLPRIVLRQSKIDVYGWQWGKSVAYRTQRPKTDATAPCRVELTIVNSADSWFECVSTHPWTERKV